MVCVNSNPHCFWSLDITVRVVLDMSMEVSSQVTVPAILPRLYNMFSIEGSSLTQIIF